MKNNYEYNEAEVRFYDIIYDKILNKSGFDFIRKKSQRQTGRFWKLEPAQEEYLYLLYKEELIFTE